MAVHTSNDNLQTKPMPEARRKLPRWFKRRLELRVPMIQLRCALAHISRIRADSEGIDIDDFNRQVAKDMAHNYVETQGLPVASVFKPTLRIELVPPSAQTPCPKNLEATLAHLAEEQFMPTWHAQDLLLHGDAPFGCLLVNHEPLPATPNMLLHCELYSALSLLRRRVDNLEDEGRPEETPHELAPPAVIVTIAQEKLATPAEDNEIDLTAPEHEFIPPRLCVRTIRASFEDVPLPRDSDTEFVLKIEVGKILDMTDVHRVHEWTVEDRARWVDKVGVLMRHVLDPRLGKAAATEQEMLEQEKTSESLSESSETPTHVASEEAESSIPEVSLSLYREI
ncbi:hypothetical protein HRG_009028 [Hirsutella rhossiliensis]|uniref:Uncharacterized protein n=1 Tax=Hirsutella rhossiliensis TaxID=111463 RepID=A0A9P8MS17_9HYPO|nr:uncharacterized protein HRG_09028 [Hirsutella rhossiliensis]KAH0960007.1 hypothetical protein HRG_09028 [Hirsutella rhossiliensis]